jgi:hypothetical protein
MIVYIKNTSHIKDLASYGVIYTPAQCPNPKFRDLPEGTYHLPEMNTWDRYSEDLIKAITEIKKNP